MLLVFMTLLGAFYPAIDLAAGEKERGTLEALLTVPVPAGNLVAGQVHGRGHGGNRWRRP
jgi:sodium transport system permease protein